jgi:hypothetical protein
METVNQIRPYMSVIELYLHTELLVYDYDITGRLQLSPLRLENDSMHLIDD